MLASRYLQDSLLSILAIAALMVPAGAARSEEPVTEPKGLIGHWLFEPASVKDQTVKNLAGGSDATIKGKVAFAPVGKLSALNLDGKSVEISVREKYTDAKFPTKNITAEAWVRIDQYLGDGGLVGILQDNGNYEKGWLLGYQGQKFCFAVKAVKGPATLTYLQSKEPFETGVWYHVVGVYDGSVQQLYVNGKLAATSKAQSGDIDYPPKAFYQIGAYRDDDEFYRLTGALHEVRVWNEPLSEEQVTARYKVKSGIIPPVPSLRLPRVFGSGMVLQRDRPVPVWGWADPGEKITAAFNGSKVDATADKDGKWRLQLPAQKAGGPFELVLTGKQFERKFTDVMVGEVWVCSGQSNMQWSVWQAANSKEEIASAKYPNIRMLNVPQETAPKPAENGSGLWQVCSPETAGGFSAVAYYYGRHLHKELDVPIGLINVSWGGSVCEAWISRDALEKDPGFSDIVKQSEKNPGACSGMYNQMIHPLIPYGIRGAIWYQGESNVSRAFQYRTLFPTLIKDWRARWGQGDFPFYYVQIAPFNYRQNNTACAELWEAQAMTLKVPNTGMAVTVDIGNVGDIHPKNKQDVGKRLALWALAKDYGKKDLVHSGPLYKSMKAEGEKIELRFDHIGSGLATRDDKPLSWFMVAGSDQKFFAAEAKIDGDKVVVRSESVKAPVAVRFGWDGTAQPNLMNKEGLPASPFRTDDWKGVTAPEKGKAGGKKVLFIGLDGCRPDALLAAKAPNLHGLIKNGSFSDKAQTDEFTGSGSGWTALLTGVWPKKHGIRGNNFESANLGEFPTLHQRITWARPSSFVASVVQWEPLEQRIVTKADHTTAHKTEAAVAETACKLLKDNHPDLLFVQFDEPDGAGHSQGFDPKGAPYLAAIARVDEKIGTILKALEARPSYSTEDWLIVVSTDHGGSGKGHGRDIPEHRTIFVILSGKSAVRGTIEPAPTSVDIAPTIYRHLGIKVEPRWELDGKAIGLKE